MASDRVAQLLQFLEDDPGDAFTRFALAQEFRKGGDLAEAERYLRAIVEDDPDYVGAYYHLGKVQEAQDRGDDAIATYRKGVQVAQRQRAFKDLSELQDALLQAQGVGSEDDE